ncbi:glycosyltransferase [Paenibacillus sinopodophylli]|uniref:glycosyltransferase n=1 Tax=Paenibacillus sinopodophylli TaxID=1837342 RepID=UPI00110C9109|nr:glycosyltransferase [Paenibacillus sinopodophylli]
MKIACCILVKNNEATLYKAIQSVNSLVDQVIVLDTGSKDGSVRIAKELGARVLFHNWNDSFAEARNVLIKQSINFDWIMFIDSDEEFNWSGEIDFRTWIETNAVRESVLSFECHHYEKNHPRMMSMTHVDRFFSPILYEYKGTIHERLINVRQGDTKKTLQCVDGYFKHYGYSSEFHQVKRKRNLELLYKELASNNADGLTHRYLSAEFYNAGDYSQSLKYAETALELLTSIQSYSKAQAHYYKLMSLLQLGDQNAAETSARKCIDEWPSYTDPYCIIAEICFSQNRWQEAAQWYGRWVSLIRRPNHTFPNHCISLVDIVSQHNWVCSYKMGDFKVEYREEVKEMKISVLLAYPQLEYDREDLLRHIQSVFHKFQVEIGIWSPKLNEHSKEVVQWLEGGVDRVVQGGNVEEAIARFESGSHSNILWLWKANERLATEINDDIIVRTALANGEILVKTYSERIGHEAVEKRIKLLDAGIRNSESKSYNSMLYRNENTGGNVVNRPVITIEMPLIVAEDKKQAYLELLKEQGSIQQLLIAFGGQRYKDVLALVEPDRESKDWRTFQFFQILSLINMDSLEEATDKIYTVLDADLDEIDQLDFIYLYGKMTVNIQIKEMKKEVCELLSSTLQNNPIIDTKLVLTTESHWLALIAELQWQLGDKKQAFVSWNHSLQNSAYLNEACAFRLAEAIYEEYKSEGIEKISRKVLEIFNVDNPTAQSLLYPLFCYLNMQEWAVLFLRHRESGMVTNEFSPLVSIVMPVYNDSKYLFESIRSILAQTHLQLELIIIDDGSTEDIASIVNRFKFDSRISYYRTATNRGLPHALNYGFSKAKGEYRCWTSADNYVHQRWLERMIGSLSTYPNASAVYSDYYHVDSNGMIIETKRLPNYRLNGLQNGGPSLMWRTSSHKRTGGFDESIFGIEDRDFTVRLALTGRIVHLQEPLYYYRIHEESLSSKIDTGTFGGWEALHLKLKKKWLHLSFV